MSNLNVPFFKVARSSYSIYMSAYMKRTKEVAYIFRIHYHKSLNHLFVTRNKYFMYVSYFEVMHASIHVRTVIVAFVFHSMHSSGVTPMAIERQLLCLPLSLWREKFTPL